MRTSTYISSKNNQQETVDQLIEEMGISLTVLTTKSSELQAEISRLTATSSNRDTETSGEENTEKAKKILHDVQTIQALQTTTTAYLETLKVQSTLCITHNKLSEKDIETLTMQANALRQLSESMNNSSNPKSLSALIEETKYLGYNPSMKQIWLRRAGLIVGTLLSSIAAITTVAALMTPGVNIATAGALIPTMITSILAFAYLHKPAVSHTQMAVGPMNVDVATPVPSTLGILAAGGLGIQAMKKAPITAKPKEISARQAQAAHIQFLANKLLNKIDTLDDANEAKSFIKLLVNETAKMHTKGASSRLRESQTSNMEKARLILAETAKMMENEYIPRDIQSVMNYRSTDSRYTLGQLINAQRNSSTFWKSTTSLYERMERAADKAGITLESTTKVNLSDIARADFQGYATIPVLV